MGLIYDVIKVTRSEPPRQDISQNSLNVDRHIRSVVIYNTNRRTTEMRKFLTLPSVHICFSLFQDNETTMLFKTIFSSQSSMHAEPHPEPFIQNMN